MDSKLASGKLPEVMDTHKSEWEPGMRRATDSIEGESVHIRWGTQGRLKQQDRVDMVEVDSLPEELHREVGIKGEGRRTFLLF